MKAQSLKFVPDEMLVRVVKLIKEQPDSPLIEQLGKMEWIVMKDIDKDLVARLVCISVLPTEQLTNQEKIWRGEMEKAEKALMGVWSAPVRKEAIYAKIILFSGSEAKRERFRESLGEISRLTDDDLKVAGALLGPGR